MAIWEKHSWCRKYTLKYLKVLEHQIGSFRSVAQLCLTLCDPMGYTVHGILQARILEWVAFPFSRGPFQTRSPALQVDSLSAEPQGKPKNTGVGSLSLLQHIFPTQESNWGLLHCRQILYQLSYQGSPSLNNPFLKCGNWGIIGESILLFTHYHHLYCSSAFCSLI